MNLKKKSLAVLFSALTVMMLASGCGKAKLGYVDQSRLQKESPQIEAVMKEWDGKMADLQKEAADTLSQDKLKSMLHLNEDSRPTCGILCRRSVRSSGGFYLCTEKN